MTDNMCTTCHQKYHTVKVIQLNSDSLYCVNPRSSERLLILSRTSTTSITNVSPSEKNSEYIVVDDQTVENCGIG